MNTVLFVNAAIGFSENLFLVVHKTLTLLFQLNFKCSIEFCSIL